MDRRQLILVILALASLCSGQTTQATFNSHPQTAPTKAPFTNNTTYATTGYADNNFKGVSVTGFRDDFLITPVATLTTGGNVTVTSDSGIWMGFGIVASATWSGGNPGTFRNPGVASITTGTTSGNGGTITKGNGNNGALGALGSNAGWEANFVVSFPSSTASESMRIGFVIASQENADPPTDGFWVRYDTGVPDTNYTWEVRAASTSTTSTTNSIAADANYHHFKIRSITAGTILFSVDGGTETAISTNVPAGTVQLFLQIITRTAAAKILDIDFISYMAANGRT
jgi:hypothetical protein